MHEIEFKATIELRGYNPYIAVSAEQAAAIAPGWRRPIPVLVQLNGGPTRPWRINMMPVGDGSFYLYLDNRIRKPTGTGVGDGVTVKLGKLAAQPQEGGLALYRSPAITVGAEVQS